jgi:hypothetical protein
MRGESAKASRRKSPSTAKGAQILEWIAGEQLDFHGGEAGNPIALAIDEGFE